MADIIENRKDHTLKMCEEEVKRTWIGSKLRESDLDVIQIEQGW